MSLTDRPSPHELRQLRRAALAADEVAINQARRDFPRNGDILKYSGIFHYRRKEYAAAESLLTEALTFAPDDVEAVLFLMRVHYAADASDNCESSARHLLRLAPDHSDGLRTLGRIYNKRRDWIQSALIWQRLTETVADDPEAPLQAARAFERQARHADALVFANKALAADSNNGEAARIKIYSLIASGDGNHRPIVDTIAAYYRFDTGRALGLVQRMVREGRIEAGAAMIAALAKAHPDDQAVSRLAATMAEAWTTETLRSEVQGQDDKAAKYAVALRLITSSDGDSIVIEAAPVATPALADGHAPAEPEVSASPGPALAAEDFPAVNTPNWLARLSNWALRVWRRPRPVPSPDRVETEVATTAPPQEAAATAPELAHPAQNLDTEAPRTEDNASALNDAPAADLPAQPSAPEAMRIRARAMLASGAIDDAAEAVSSLFLESIDDARTWLAGQPEIWTSLVGVKALSRTAIARPDRPDLAFAADQAGIECLADGFEHEIGGDLVRAFVGFYAAASVRPSDQDAMLGVARVRAGCRAQILADLAEAAALPPATAVLLALTRR